MKIGISPAAVRFSPPNSRLPAVIPANAGIHFCRQTPAFTSFFLWKNEVNSQFCSSKWIPAFAGMTAFFCGIPPIPPRSREWNVLFPGRFAGNDGVFFAENAGFCSSKLLRLVSPPTNVRGLSVFVVFFCGFGWAGGFFRSNFGGGGIQLIGTLFNRGG